MGTWDPLLIILSLAAAAGGAWFGAYLREKGKRYATSEDLEKILAELRATTRTAEEIKAQISEGLWLQQQRWNYRLTVYERLFGALAESERLLALLSYRQQHIREGDHTGAASLLAGAEQMNDNGVALRRSALLASAVLPEEARRAIDSLLGKFDELSCRMGDPRTTDAFLAGVREAEAALIAAVRKDLIVERRIP